MNHNAVVVDIDVSNFKQHIIYKYVMFWKLIYYYYY